MKNLYSSTKILLLLLSLFAFQISASAQVNLVSAGYRQEFNTLGTSTSFTNGTTIPGWFVQLGTAIANPKTLVVTQAQTSSASNATGSSITNFGVSGSTDRAIGSYVSGKTAMYYGVWIKNSTGQSISSIDFKFDIRTVYNGKNANGLTLSFKKVTNFSSTTDPQFAATTGWTSVANAVFTNNFPAENGGGSSSTPASSMTAATHTVNIPVVLAVGEEVFVRFLDEHANGNSGQDDDLAIDNFEVTSANILVNTFYNKPNVSLNDLSTWNSLAAGTGVNCSNFSTTNQTFYVQNSATLSSPLSLGAGSKVIVRNGATLTLNADLSGTIDLESGATVVVNTNNAPSFGSVSNSSTISYTGAAPLTLTSYGNLTISGVSKALNASTTVNGTLRLAGNGGRIVLGQHNLILENPAISYTDNLSYLIATGTGMVKVHLSVGQSSTIPVGAASITPIFLSLTAGERDYFGVRTLDGLWSKYTSAGAPSSDAVQIVAEAVTNTWFIEEDVTTQTVANNMTVSLYWTVADEALNFNREGSLQLGHFTNGAWDHGSAFFQGAIASPNMYNVQRTGIKTFSPFAVYSSSLASTPGVLPVELVSFSGKSTGEAVDLSWATAAEKDNDYFQIERSQNGKTFTTVGKVKGNGNSNVLLNYNFSDVSASAGLNYYRLKQVDFNGEFEYSKVIAVKADAKAGAQPILEVYPNPTVGKVYVTSSQVSGAAAVTVFQSNGRVVVQQNVQVEVGQPLSIDLANYVPGVYYLQVQTATEKVTARVVKQ